MADIRPADAIDFARFYGPVQVASDWFGHALWRGRLVAGFGGMIETGEGEWLAFLEVPANERKPMLYRRILDGFKEAKARGAHTIRACCDPDIPRSEALMLRLGFCQTYEQINGKAVWTCSLQH
ncbi:MAG: hypothetical protein IBJ07_12275 [Rhizobiaceae bacterium]|nr:hypothetical protein [Rhizobiaceae bacterium]